MQLQWDGRVGPAAILTAIGIAANIAVFVWVGSAFVTKVTSKVDAQADQIKEYREDSNKRFEMVGSAIRETRDAQSQAVSDVSSVKTAIAYISEQLHRVEARLDGSSLPAPSIPPPKP